MDLNVHSLAVFLFSLSPEKKTSAGFSRELGLELAIFHPRSESKE